MGTASIRRPPQPHQRLAWQGNEEVGRRADQRDPRGEPVEAVDQVHGVDDADDPRDGEHDSEWAELEDRAADEMDVLDAEAREPQVQRHRELDEELLHRAAAEDVVEDSQAGDGEAAEQKRKGAAAVGVEHAAETGRVEDEGEKRRIEPGDDGNAAEARNAGGMHLPRIGDVIEQSSAAREASDHWNERATHECRAKEGDQFRAQKGLLMPYEEDLAAGEWLHRERAVKRPGYEPFVPIVNDQSIPQHQRG